VNVKAWFKRFYQHHILPIVLPHGDRRRVAQHFDSVFAGWSKSMPLLRLGPVPLPLLFALLSAISGWAGRS
jgi:hypothetical protein